MSKTEKSDRAGGGSIRFEMRLSPADAVRLEAISTRLRLTKADVLRLSLSPDFERRHADASGRDVSALSESLDALSARASAVEDRLKSVESLLDSAVDLLLAISRNSQSADRPPAANDRRSDAGDGAPSWEEFLKKNPKSNPIMPTADWHEFLRNRYIKTFGREPVINQ